MTELRLVIFDVDGTLVDSQADILAAMGAAFAAEGLKMPPRARVRVRDHDKGPAPAQRPARPARPAPAQCFFTP